MKSLLHVCFLCLLLWSKPVWAQTTDEKAQSAYLTANDAYEKGNYTEALSYLKQARDLLGKTNSKIQYLLVKVLLNAKEYPAADAELKTYFAVTPEIARDARYDEMVKNVVFVERMRKESQEREAVQTKKRSDDSLAALQQQRLASFERMRNLRVIIPENQRRITGKKAKGWLTMLASIGLFGGFIAQEISNKDSNKDSDASLPVIAGVGTGVLIMCSISSFSNAKNLRRTNKFYRQELERLETNSTKKQITLSPYYTPYQQTAGLAVRMRF
ncbi:tetratricopeptide repeat protein [Spirosoma sp. KCTC 42546]|uniref:tetratricopeptide repeat protein n=1 Tax=Spirosoma sp. KCTC 42546 TaxID=2520506 RepID=UPI00115AFA98|nr:tetratricopeptide repeat protein [Spirosoma sp. KCTC 42546]QDK81575.1 tetratricopeptide repeat protein [Spirosoma sp. KCTC 42546]